MVILVPSTTCESVASSLAWTCAAANESGVASRIATSRFGRSILGCLCIFGIHRSANFIERFSSLVKTGGEATLTLTNHTLARHGLGTFVAGKQRVKKPALCEQPLLQRIPSTIEGLVRTASKSSTS